ncbi:MAG: hypothetical protein AAF564_22175 [Bacteroidota bacterium]
MQTHTRVLPAFLFLMAAVVAIGCTQTPSDSSADAEPMMPAAQTYADSVAHKAYDAMGGVAAFAALPVLRYNFGFDRGGERTVRNKHLWNKHTGDYRLEYTDGQDSSFVVLFNVNTREGTVYLNGETLAEEEQGARLETAYSSFINDSYWLIAPMKMMDPGVNRSLAADSSNAATDVLHLSFEGVGLTPGDQYWMYVDKATGRLDRWAFVLQGNPDAPARAFDWTDYKTFDTPAGTLSFSERKQSVGAPFALLTDGVAIYNEAPEGMMANTTAMLD